MQLIIHKDTNVSIYAGFTYTVVRCVTKISCEMPYPRKGEETTMKPQSLKKIKLSIRRYKVKCGWKLTTGV